jgi:hypothetical protein
MWKETHRFLNICFWACTRLLFADSAPYFPIIAAAVLHFSEFDKVIPESHTDFSEKGGFTIVPITKNALRRGALLLLAHLHYHLISYILL